MSDHLKLEIKREGHSTREHEIVFGVYPVGSDNDNKIIIPDTDVAPRHAILILRPDGFWVENLNNQNGTFIDGRPFNGRAAFTVGQELRIGSCSMKVYYPDSDKSSVPEPAPVVESSVNMPAAPQSSHAPLKQKLSDSRDEQKRAIKRQIHAELLERLDITRLTAANIGEKDLHDRAQKMLELIISDISKRLPSWINQKELQKEVFDEAVGLGPLEDLLADPEITEIMVNRFDQIYVERSGNLSLSDRTFMDNNSVLAIIERIVAPIGRRIDESQPYVDARLKDGSRVNAIIPPLALTGPCLTIRKFSEKPFKVEDLIRFKTMTRDIADFLDMCVKLRKNIVVAGGTGSGKTTFLNVISLFLPQSNRIVTIEDSAELKLTQQHIVRLESRPPNIEGKGAITIRDLLRNALRMRPDRIIIGECRGGEALDMLQAMNTGHDGSMTTVHANTPRDVISRLETMTLMAGMELPLSAIREQIGSAVHLVVQTARLSDGTRKVTNVTEITGMEGDRITMQDIFVFKQTGCDAEGRVLGSFMATGAVPTFLEAGKARGMQIDMSMFDPRKGNGN